MKKREKCSICCLAKYTPIETKGIIEKGICDYCGKECEVGVLIPVFSAVYDKKTGEAIEEMETAIRTEVREEMKNFFEAGFNRGLQEGMKKHD